ncbi:hypothetical protein [Paenibacillus popilliae]|uniref:Uncharacterized protein n=1 Tax=Paenibacillus popilliae ATCC 14706 TaxID=1212764 RepID=M9LIB1_PAEPP|nr:hypothetical protein [Paenibacillus popilliae]GAC42770.1 hypothetical protein PPOP_2130 [Paenibacillus popilliae ATCC 14706]
MENELLHQILSELRELKAGQQKLEAEQKKMNERLDSIEKDTALIPMIKQATLETNETVRRVELSQERQEGIIEVLSVRSIEQEAAIKRTN